MADEWDKYVVSKDDEWEKYAQQQPQAGGQAPQQEISAGQPQQQNILQKLFGASPQEQTAEAQNAYAVSQVAGVPMRDVVKRDLTRNPEYTGIKQEPTPVQAAIAMGTLIGVPAIIPELIAAPMATVGGLAVAGGVAKVMEYAKPLERLTNENTSQQVKQGAKDGDALLTALLSIGGYKAASNVLGKFMPNIGLGAYAKNKTIAIRKGAMQEYQRMQTEYGNELNSLSTNPQKTDPTNVIGKMEEIIQQRMPESYSLSGVKTRTPPTSKVDSALLKAYERLSGKWANSTDGKVTVGDIVSEFKIIKDSGGVGKKPDSNTHLAKQIQRELLNASANDIDIPKFNEMQSKYKKGMDDLDLLDKYFDIWESDPRITKKGETFLKGGMNKSEEAKGISELVTSKTQQTLKGAKAINTTRQIMGNKILQALLAGSAIGAGIKISKSVLE